MQREAQACMPSLMHSISNQSPHRLRKEGEGILLQESRTSSDPSSTFKDLCNYICSTWKIHLSHYFEVN